MATISISQLDTATQASVDDLYEVAVVDGTSQTGYASRKLTAAQIATLIAQGVQFSGLSTEAKTIIAAINEAAQNGGTEVEANPSGAATDTLKKIGIDGTIYEVGGSEPVSKTVTGNPINITDAADAPIVSGTVAFEPIQDLHGYDKPWAGGNGKNKLPLVLADIKAANTTGTWNGNAYTLNGVTFTVLMDDAGNITGINANGENTGSGRATLNLCTVQTLNSLLDGNYIFSGCPSDGSESTYRMFIGSSLFNTGGDVNFSTPLSGNNCGISIYQGYDAQNLMFYPMIRLDTETDPSFEQYSNECPIEGYTDCEIEVTDDATSPTVTNTYTIDLDGTRYGGTVDLGTGEVTVTHKLVTLDGSENWGKSSLTQCDIYMFSNSEANLSKPFFLSYYGYWPSNYNVVGYGWKGSSNVQLRIGFAEYGTTTVTNFKDYLSNNPLEFCFTLATPFTVQLTPEQIRTLEGTNNISTNMTDMSLEYITQEYQPLVKLIERSAGNHYSTQERVIGTWFGKPLYEKVVDFGTLPNTTSKSVAHDISNLDAICFVDAIANNGSGAYIPIPFVSKSGLQYQLSLNLTTTDIVINTGDNFTTYSAFITLQYTKTTD